MNVITLPVQHKSQAQRSVVRLEATSRSLACGHENPPEAAFCGECGALLSLQTSASVIPSTAATRRAADERLSQSSLQVLKNVAKDPSPQENTRNIARRTPPVGREWELTQLQTVLETALQGERQIVFVTGEAGIGKT